MKRKKDEDRFCEEIKKIKDEKISDREKETIKTTIQALKEKLLLYDNNQKSWILNAIEAMDIYL